MEDLFFIGANSRTPEDSFCRCAVRSQDSSRPLPGRLSIAYDQRPEEKCIDSFAVRKSIQGQIHEIMFLETHLTQCGDVDPLADPLKASKAKGREKALSGFKSVNSPPYFALLQSVETLAF
jgi:hypothetical protein